jgi:hypothetical protein
MHEWLYSLFLVVRLSLSKQFVEAHGCHSLRKLSTGFANEACNAL